VHIIQKTICQESKSLTETICFPRLRRIADNMYYLSNGLWIFFIVYTNLYRKMTIQEKIDRISCTYRYQQRRRRTLITPRQLYWKTNQTQYKMNQNNMNALFDALPTDLQDKVCEKIVYKQPVVLTEEIKTTRFADTFYKIQKIFVNNPKKLSSLTVTLAVMRKYGAVKQAEVFEKIMQEIMRMEKLLERDCDPQISMVI